MSYNDNGQHCEHACGEGQREYCMKVLNSIEFKVTSIDDMLRGTNAQPGLIHRVSSLEKSEVGRTRLMWAAMTSFAAAAGAWAWSLLHTK